jgi:lysozyme
MEKITTCSPNGVAFIKTNESCVLHPYFDAAKVATIGWGMDYYPNGIKVGINDPAITQEQADVYFLEILSVYENAVAKSVTVPINQNQFDACVDFAYNCGDGAFETSTLCSNINKGLPVTLQNFTQYDHVGQEVDQNLLTRRTEEYNLFISSNNQNNNQMNPETTGLAAEAETPVEASSEAVEAQVEAEKQVITVLTFSITYTKVANGQTETTTSPDFKANPELLAALAKTDFIEPNYNIVVGE